MEKEIIQNNNTVIPEPQTEPQEVPQSTTQTPKTPKQKPGLIIGITALALLILGITSFLIYRNYQTKSQPSETEATQKPTPSLPLSENWETYTDSKNMFIIKYPPTLFAQGGPQQTFFIKKEATTAERMDYSDHLVEIIVNKMIQRFESYYQTPNNKTVEGYGDLKLRSYKIDGYPAVEYGYNKESKDKELKEQAEAMESGASVGMIYFPRGIIINKDDTIIEISTKSYFGEFKQTFDQILSTFKFIE